MRATSICDVDFTWLERCILTTLCILFVLGVIVAIYCFIQIMTLAYEGQLVDTYYKQDYYDYD